MANDVGIVVPGDAEAAARAAGERLAGAARAGGHVVLTGGRTPKRAYEHAAELEPDWSRVELWWGDERCVPPDDDNSNYRLAKQVLLDRVTLTLPALRAAREVLFLVAGEDKADAVRRAFAGDPSRATPGSLVRATSGATTAVLDEAAAARLDSL